jgi:chemotaxis protein CheY-P-specific phosphatase CheC
MDKRSREGILIHVLNTGFEKAAASFSKMTGRTVKITTTKSILAKHDHDLSFISEERGDLTILTTQIIGDISGKSFLILNHEETAEIFKVIHSSMNKQELKDGFLLEIDNIISASVISELSNALGVEIYGDVPLLEKVHAENLHEFMSADLVKDNFSSVILSNTTFNFDSSDKIHPQFIWKINSKIFELIPAEKLSA